MKVSIVLPKISIINKLLRIYIVECSQRLCEFWRLEKWPDCALYNNQNDRDVDEFLIVSLIDLYYKSFSISLVFHNFKEVSIGSFAQTYIDAVLDCKYKPLLTWWDIHVLNQTNLLGETYRCSIKDILQAWFEYILSFGANFPSLFIKLYTFLVILYTYICDLCLATQFCCLLLSAKNVLYCLIFLYFYIALCVFQHAYFPILNNWRIIYQENFLEDGTTGGSGRMCLSSQRHLAIAYSLLFRFDILNNSMY